MIRADMPEVMAIENDCFSSPWPESEFVEALRCRSVIGMVAEHGTRVVGYVVYDLRKNDIHILNMAVDRKFWRQLVGTSIIEKIKVKLNQQKRRLITAEVRETNIAAQKFFKAQGFICVETIRDCYEGTDEAGYRFQYDIHPPLRQILRNRVTSDAMERRQ
jgi:ribosomal-protein-alanine N-acetyltransferase